MYIWQFVSMSNDIAKAYTKDVFDRENPLHAFWNLLLFTLTKLERGILCALLIKSPKTLKNINYLQI